ISYATASGDVVSLYFHAQTHLLSKLETLTSHSLFGDVVVETAFTGYAQLGGVQLPTGQVNKRGGALTLEVAFSHHTVEPLPDAAFAPPAGFVPAPQPSAAEPAVRELAENVYLIEGLGGGAYRVLFVALRDFVLVVEAPVNEAVSGQAIRLIKETVGGKPIHFIVPTHHHDDHAGGIRAFSNEGAIILTTEGNARYFVRAALAKFTVQPDRLARSGRQFVSSSQILDTVIDGKAVVQNGGRTVEIYDIGPGPHAEEMLVVWLPEEKILFQGDLFNRGSDGALRPANETTIHFSQWLKKSGLPVQRLIGVHSQESTMADLEASLQMAAGPQ
ncbi:MAG TPA: MBL fold metallo-hydrolase, partial [Verrucomicrobiae bacterium]|nr:MBL fold metallo-hydrolase [Verrucomicrobiae bacterium]